MSNLAENLYAFLPEPELQDFSWLPGERRVLKRREPLPNGCADHAARHRVVRQSSIPGPWQHENAPYLWRIMVTYSLPWVREINLAKGSQLGGSEIIYNTHLYDVDHEPGPGLIVMPSRDTTKDASLDRVQPLYEDCAVLRKLLTPNPDDLAMTRIKLRNGVVTYFGWAGSDAVLASKPIKYVKIDEADLVGRRPINLAVARLRTFAAEYKLLKVSKTSVDTGPIWEDLLASHVIYDYHVACPHCGHDQVMTFGQFRWTEGVTDPRRIELTKDAWYECEACGQRWDEFLRDSAVKAAMYDGWKPRRFCAACFDVQLRDGVCPRCGGTELADLPAHPEKIGYHLPAFYSRFVPFWTIVADYLRYQADPTAKEGDAPSNAEKFWCDDCALPMPTTHEGETLDEQLLYNRREEYRPASLPGPEWEIPLAASLLTAFVDVQGNRLEILVEAWGEKKENWGILHEIIPEDPATEEAWTKLETYLERTWLHECGVRLPLAALGIDTGGHHTDEVYKFVRKWRRRRNVYAMKGWHIPGKPIKGKPSMNNAFGVPLYMIGTENAKKNVFSWLTAENPGPYYQHFPRAFSFEFFRQLCAEEPKWKKDNRGRPVEVFQVRKGYKRNEGLDLKANNIAVYEILNPVMETVRENLLAQARELVSEPKEERPSRRRQQRDEDDGRTGRDRPGWYGRGR